MRIMWHARASREARMGYGRVGWKIPTFLEDAGAELLDSREWDWDWRIVCGLPESWYLQHGGVIEDLCLHTMCEATPLDDSWVDVLNHIGLIWVPSQWCKDVFIESGVVRPIMVCGYGIDVDEYPYIHRERGGSLPYTFLAMDFSIFGRKRMTKVVEAFVHVKRKLPDMNLRLVVKTNTNWGQPPPWGSDDIPIEFYNGKAGPWNIFDHGERVRHVSIVTGLLTTGEMKSLFALADCFVHPTAGEGFGLPVMEAMGTGLPAITSAHSGQMEYLRDDVALLLDTKPVALGDDEAGPIFAEADFEQLVDHMVWCATNRKMAEAIGKRASDYVTREWTWDSAGEKALALLEEHLRRREI